MLKYLRFLFLFIISFSLSTALTSCGSDSNDEPDEPEMPEQPTTITIKESDIVGTWRYSSSDYGNIDYISFSGSGDGIMVEAADLFRNVAAPYSSVKGGCPIKFTYTISGNKITVFPDVYGIKDFEITVNELGTGTIDITIPIFIKKRRVMRKYKDDWEWFFKEGPASEDLTKDFVGYYKVDSNNNWIIKVSKINNYTISVEDQYLHIEKKGELWWYRVSDDSVNEIYLYECGKDESYTYWFDKIDKKLYSFAYKSWSFEGGATKISN